MLRSLIWKTFGSGTCICVMRHQKKFLFFGQRRQKKWFEEHKHPEFRPST